MYIKVSIAGLMYGIKRSNRMTLLLGVTTMVPYLKIIVNLCIPQFEYLRMNVWFKPKQFSA